MFLVYVRENLAELIWNDLTEITLPKSCANQVGNVSSLMVPTLTHF